MQVVTTIAECRAAMAEARKSGRRVGFVPTMGGLHAGHVSLIERGRGAGNFVVVSIFVNPTQFGPTEDFSKYPRPVANDRKMCEAAGCDVIFNPTAAEIYAAGDETRVRPGRLAEGLCGPFRPGHFEGVCTVVAKLFEIVRPDVAYFGQKDAQQAVIIRRLAADLKMGIEIEVCPIVRESDGLAMSTRNQYLKSRQRTQAASLYRALCAGRDRIAAGERRSGLVVAAMRRVLDEAGPCTIDYIAIVDPETLEEVDPVDRRVMLALAVRLEGARLIDNLIVG